jgi:hypothetical protein
LLSPKPPTVTPNRLPSGIGLLTFEAASSDAVGDLRLGCAYELAGGHSSTVQHSRANASAPKNSRNPVIVLCLGSVNLVKPGVGETTRVLLRRGPRRWRAT